MKANDVFLAELMKTVDLNLFTPSLYAYFRDYFEIERVRRFGDQFVINSFIPPFPSAAFDRFLSAFFGKGENPPIQSVDLAVTNACVFHCWHCYNAGRPVADLPTETLKRSVAELQELGTMVVNFTGGEPCLRHDLREICSALREDSSGLVSTTGYGYTDEMARGLRDSGVYAIAVSLDSPDEKEHDKKRGVKGAFRIALKGIEMAKKWGFYTYVCTVPSKELLEEENFRNLIELVESLGVSEVQLLEPSPAGRLLSGKTDFGEAEFEKEFRYMREYNSKEGGVAVTSFAHMESPEFFGCSAGYSHIYIDGSGEVSPCNLLPLSYGNVGEEPLRDIIARMQSRFGRSFCNCLARTLNDFFKQHCQTTKPVRAEEIPTVPLPYDEELPRFFQILSYRDREVAGHVETVLGYSSASAYYDDYWLSVAGEPIDELFDKLEIKPGQWAIDCACGTGYSTAKLAQRVGRGGTVLAIDLTPGMIEKAKARMRDLGLENVEFRIGDVLEQLEGVPEMAFDVATLTWLIGYVGCDEIFPLLRRVLKPGGYVGFVAHLDRSPRVPIEVFEGIVRDNPASLAKAVKFKFPKDDKETERHLREAGFGTQWMKQGSFNYVGKTGKDVFNHVMKSGAATTFYYSLRPSEREPLSKEFVDQVNKRFAGAPEIVIVHDYVVGIGVRQP
ncbi:MAG: methyltransferase domain-containing protein [bacterium]|nr:methyltransferase domain-containing protein [bacterium]